MPDMNFFDGFSFSWASNGPVATLSQEAVKAGWNFIGQTPPAVEQFNAVHNMDGLRQQWLFGQVKGVTDQAGMPLTAGATNTLWLAIKAKLDTKQDGLGYTPVQQGGGAGQGTNKVYIGWAGGTLRGQVDATDLGSFVFAGRQFTAGAGLTGGGTFDSDRVLSMGTPSSISSSSQNVAGGASHTHELSTTGVTAGTYGSNSKIGRFTVDSKGRITGADSQDINLPDLVGILPIAKGGTGAGDAVGARSNLGLNAFLALAEASLQANGYVELASNDGSFRFLLQWGQATVGGDSSQAISWPKPFPNQCLNAVAGLGFIFSPTGDAGCSIRDLTPAGAVLMQGTANAGTVRYFAIGY